jgi:hypothetical protein
MALPTETTVIQRVAEACVQRPCACAAGWLATEYVDSGDIQTNAEQEPSPGDFERVRRGESDHFNLFKPLSGELVEVQNWEL